LFISCCFSNRSADLYHFLLLQVTGKDKDYRYMATSDLLNELSKDTFKADNDLEIKISNTVLQQLDDVAGDVSGLAVKWFVVSLLF
jgi:cullin-associated NEDD8-dissociated protein 1